MLGDRQAVRVAAGRSGRGLTDLRDTDVSRELCLHARALASDTERAWRGGSVVFTPAAAAVVVQALTLDLIARPRSRPFGTAPAVSLLDDPRLPGAAGSELFDLEGALTGRTVLARKGGGADELVVRRASHEGAAHRLTGHARRSPRDVTPLARPANVRLESDGFQPPDQMSGQLCYDVRGHGTQLTKAGEEITLNLSMAVVEDGRVIARCPDALLRATADTLLAAVERVSEPSWFVRSGGLAVAASWMRMRCDPVPTP
ncbi:metallopeptidase TldD-related protein [Streptomyces vinaceus]|uniref:metallopeptidase TldD-related protein n=1 Tax=Streptomyces vinaceus TaxID=1960 RepID=UPI0036BA2BD5